MGLGYNSVVLSSVGEALNSTPSTTHTNVITVTIHTLYNSNLEMPTLLIYETVLVQFFMCLYYHQFLSNIYIYILHIAIYIAIYIAFLNHMSKIIIIEY